MSARDVDCPTCSAPKGERCRGSAYSGRSHRTVDYHADRRQAARAGEPLGSRRDRPHHPDGWDTGRDDTPPEHQGGWPGGRRPPLRSNTEDTP